MQSQFDMCSAVIFEENSRNMQEIMLRPFQLRFLTPLCKRDVCKGVDGADVCARIQVRHPFITVSYANRTGCLFYSVNVLSMPRKGGVPLGTGFGAEAFGACECLGGAFPLTKLALQNKLVGPSDTIYSEKYYIRR